MSDFHVRSDSIDVEEIMEQIRGRIREKRGVDYTEQQLQELAAVKLERFLDPRGVRSDLLQRFRERQPRYERPQLPLYGFEDTTIYATHRGLLQWIRRMLRPVLKLFFNPNPIVDALHAQSKINDLNLEREERHVQRGLEIESLYYEILHNLVFELTRSSIEVKNLKMRVESLSSRLEFSDRRARALESAVAYRPPSNEDREQSPARESRESAVQPIATSGGLPQGSAPEGTPADQAQTPVPGGPPEGPGQRSRRRRRRRGRRSGPPASAIMGATVEGGAIDSPGDHEEAGGEADAPDSSEPDSPHGESDPTDPGSDSDQQ